MNSVPSHGNQAANDCRNVRSEDTEHAAADHRIGHTGGLAGFGHQIAEEIDDRDADQQCDEYLPTGQAEGEKTTGRDLSTNAVYVGHPEREDVVRRPGLIA